MSLDVETSSAEGGDPERICDGVAELPAGDALLGPTHVRFATLRSSVSVTSSDRSSSTSTAQTK